MNEIILAMKPKWLHLIIEKKKTCEVRRTGPKVVPDWLFLYQGGCIHGLAHVVGVVKPVILNGAAMIGAETLREACLTQEQFTGYMGTWTETSRIYKLGGVAAFPRPVPVPCRPQSWQYMTDEILYILRKEVDTL